MKKKVSVILSVMVLFFALSLVTKLDAHAASTVKVSGMSKDRTTIGVTATGKDSTNVFNEILIKNNSEVVKDVYMLKISGTTLKPLAKCGINGLSKNKIYKVYTRKVSYNPDTVEMVPITKKWKSLGTITTASYSYGTNSSKKAGFWLKAPKITGVKQYKVYTKIGKQGFKKVGTLKPGVKKKFTKNGKQKFKSGTYKIKIVPVLKKGKCSGFAAVNKSYDIEYRLIFRW